MQPKPTYNSVHRLAAIVMFGALSWLTVCLPYVYSFQKELAKQESRSVQFDCPVDNEESNPLGNSTEEKAPTTASEEYLHHTDDHSYLSFLGSGPDNRHAYDIYIAYHGEVQSPPPNFIS